jgi:hypothetical protein
VKGGSARSKHKACAANSAHSLQRLAQLRRCREVAFRRTRHDDRTIGVRSSIVSSSGLLAPLGPCAIVLSAPDPRRRRKRNRKSGVPRHRTLLPPGLTGLILGFKRIYQGISVSQIRFEPGNKGKRIIVVASKCLRFPDQLGRAPSWETRQRQAIDFCERSRSALISEVSRYERGSDGWQVASGALDFCSEVPTILEKSQDLPTASRSVVNACGRVPLLANEGRKKRALGKSQMMNCVVLGLQTGHVVDLQLPLGLPCRWA